MFNQTFYFSTIRKYVMLFGTLFNDIVIIRPGDPASNTADQVIRVPIEYAPKEKMLARLEADPEIDRPYSLLVPRMAFEMHPMSYDGSRKLNTINQVVKKIEGNSNQLNYQYGPVPWNFPFSLYIYVKNAEDGLKIVEQILPWFTPTWTTTVNLIPEMDETRDIPITILSCSPEDRYSGDFKTRRMLIWTIEFTLKGYLYGPIKKTGIIKIANTSFYIANTTPIRDSVGNVDIAERMIIRPGLAANGAPLNYYGTAPVPNTVPTVPYTEIESTDDYGFLETYESIPVGVARPIAGANTEQTAAQTILEEDETD